MNDLTIIYYTDGVLDPPFAEAVRKHLSAHATQMNIPIICVSQPALDFGDESICMPSLNRSFRSLFTQVIAGCRRASTRYVALCEADVFYSPGHFALRPYAEADGIYDQNCHRLHLKERCIGLYRGGRSLFLLIGDRLRITANLRKKLELFRGEEDFRGRFEPGKGEQELGLEPFVIVPGAAAGEATVHIVNHGKNLSPAKKRPGDFSTDRLPDGRTVDELIEQWHLPKLGCN